MITFDEFKTYLNERGYTASDEALRLALVRSMDLIDLFEFVGSKVTQNQAHEWPRVIKKSCGNETEFVGIPSNVLKAICEAGIIAVKGVDLFPTSQSEKYVKREKVGALEIEYDVSGNNQSALTFGSPLNSSNLLAIKLLLKPYLLSGAGAKVKVLRG